MQSEDEHTSFLFVGDLNGHHQEWLGSATTNIMVLQSLTSRLCPVVPDLCVRRKVFLNTVCGAMPDLPWRYIWSSDNPVSVLNKHLSLLVGRYVPTKIIRVRNKDKPLFDDLCRRAFDLNRRLIFGGPVIALGLIGKSSFPLKSELMKHTWRPSISLVSETSMFS